MPNECPTVKGAGKLLMGVITRYQNSMVCMAVTILPAAVSTKKELPEPGNPIASYTMPFTVHERPTTAPMNWAAKDALFITPEVSTTGMPEGLHSGMPDHIAAAKRGEGGDTEVHTAGANDSL